jgi:hypothetical protein
MQKGECNMKHLYWIVLIEVMALFVGLSRAKAESEAKPRTRVADKFMVSWSSIAYDKKVSLRNPAAYDIRVSLRNPAAYDKRVWGHRLAVSDGKEQQVSETLTLSYEVESLDPNVVLGICLEPMIEEVTDGEGANVEVKPVSSKPSALEYEALQYTRRYVYPSRPARWKTAIRSALRLPPKVGTTGRHVDLLEPSRMQVKLDVGVIKRGSGEIGRVKGHFYALVAESLEYVEVPFKPSDDWTRLTPDMEIRLRDPQCTEKKFRFGTYRRPHEGASIRTLPVQNNWPDRVVVARELLGEDGKPIYHGSGTQRLPTPLFRGTSGSGSDCMIKSIRYVIAVNPTHHEIPFVLEHIPLPKP